MNGDAILMDCPDFPERLLPNDGSRLSLKASLYAMLSVSAILFFILWGDTELSVVLAIVFAVTAAFVVQHANRKRSHSTLVTLFYWLAACHTIFGYWAAKNSSDAIWIGTNAHQMYRQAEFVVAATLLVASFAYDIASGFRHAWITKLGRRLQTSESRLLAAARSLAAVGILCVLYVIVTAGFMPILADHPGQARYISDELGPQYRQYAFVMDKGRDLLTCSIPLVLFAAIVLHRKLDWMLGVAGFSAIAITLDRARLISLFVVLLVTITLRTGRLPRKLLAFLGLLIALYGGSQLVFLNAVGENTGEGAPKLALLSGFPEVRDLGWTMSLLREERFYGMTMVEPMALGYWSAADFKEHYGLGNITARLIGVPRSETGGLRITLGGEGYVNFGALGCILVGGGFGLACAWLAKLARAMVSNRDLASAYLVAMIFSWLCFWLYLAGTESTGVIKNGLSFVVVLLLLARVRGRIPPRFVPPKVTA